MALHFEQMEKELAGLFADAHAGKKQLVHTAEPGRCEPCRMEPKGLSILEQSIKDRRSLWERRFDRLEALLAEPQDQ